VGDARYLPSTSWSWSRETDVVIVGTGAAGMSAALELARRGVRVIVMSKAALSSGSTLLAQGGLAAVSGDSDSFDAHVQDSSPVPRTWSATSGTRELASTKGR
jgi:L-aspartate oxidase